MIDEGIESTETKMQSRRLEGTKNFQCKKVFFVSSCLRGCVFFVI